MTAPCNVLVASESTHVSWELFGSGAAHLSLGAGGTLPMHALSDLPPTLTVHVPQSPFLQLVFTLSPSFLHAAISEEFSPTLTDLAPLVSFTCAIVAGRVRGAACIRTAGVPVSNADHATAGSSSSSSSLGCIARRSAGFYEMSSCSEEALGRPDHDGVRSPKSEVWTDHGADTPRRYACTSPHP